jgi:hypothetical protein
MSLGPTYNHYFAISAHKIRFSSPLAPTLEHRADFSISLIIFTDGRTTWMGDQLVTRTLPKHRTT